MSDTKQPEALLPADELERHANDCLDADWQLLDKAAAELRRTHDLLGKAYALARVRAERIAELEAELEAVGAGGVGPLRKRECLHQIAEPAAQAQDKLDAQMDSRTDKFQRAVVTSWSHAMRDRDEAIAAQKGGEE